MPITHIRDLQLNYELHGEGPRVLLVSGTGADLRNDPFRANHPLVRAGFEVAMYDQRGLGQTSKPDVPYTMADYADDAAALLDHLGWESAHVIGISFGGMVAQHFALRHPDRVNKLVLACTSSGGEGGASFDLLKLQELPIAERQRVAWGVMDTRNDFSVEPPVITPTLKKLYALSIEAANVPVPSESAMGARRQLEARADHDVWNELPSIGAHTFVIGGLYDRQAPVENVERLAGRLPHAELQFFDGGHMFLLQEPTAWLRVAEFLHAQGPTT